MRTHQMSVAVLSREFSILYRFPQPSFFTNIKGIQAELKVVKLSKRSKNNVHIHDNKMCIVINIHIGSSTVIAINVHIHDNKMCIVINIHIGDNTRDIVINTGFNSNMHFIVMYMYINGKSVLTFICHNCQCLNTF